jgi:23S rRNA (guanine2445-N2)-methyltransferase / 23S rRNA (guanine2069-N7)-methyltransferase
MPTEKLKFFATTAKGMESLLAEELRQLGSEQVHETRSGVAFQGTLESGYRACLWSRIANRILLPLHTFHAESPEQLYEGVKTISWQDHLDPQNTLAVDFSTSRSKITHSYYGALKVKDAIVDQFRSREGIRPSVSLVRPDIQVNVYLNDDEATVSLDLSGESLHRRGYRQEGAMAPLKETLAAAILKFGGWPKGEDVALFDPMCGSGTLLIEAAWMSLNRAPGLSREYYGFLNWQGHIPAIWKRLLKEAEEQIIHDKKKIPKIVGYDQHPMAVRVALENIEKAGLHGKVHVEKRELSHCERIAEQGILVTNPPYGERIGDVEALRPLYKTLGDVMKQKFKGWEGFVFTGNNELAKSVGLKSARRFVLFNGPIECRLLKYELY